MVPRELHDESGKALISLIYNLDPLASEISGNFKEVHKKLGDSVKINDQTIDMIHALSQSLRPSAMDVGDNGYAMNPVNPSGHIGWFGIEDRIVGLGGPLHIYSKPPGGASDCL